MIKYKVTYKIEFDVDALDREYAEKAAKEVLFEDYNVSYHPGIDESLEIMPQYEWVSGRKYKDMCFICGKPMDDHDDGECPKNYPEDDWRENR